ncbi:hypothetical protein [Moorena sp. SIO4G3]|nr:hypothetical protein [Moorena sp. SIO4G3]
MGNGSWVMGHGSWRSPSRQPWPFGHATRTIVNLPYTERQRRTTF